MLAQKIKRKKILLLGRSLDSQSAGIHIYAKNLITHLESHGDHENFEYTIVRVGEKINLNLNKVKQVFFKNKFSLPGFASFRLFLQSCTTSPLSYTVTFMSLKVVCYKSYFYQGF